MNRGGSKEDVATHKKAKIHGVVAARGSSPGAETGFTSEGGCEGVFLVAMSSPRFLSFVLHADRLNFSRL